MTFRLKSKLIFASMFIFTLGDGSGQDARFYGRRADHEFVSTGRIPEALALYDRAYRAAVAASDSVFQYRFLNNIGACQVKLFRFGEAVQTLSQVRLLAAAAHDDAALGSVNGNLAAVYAQMDDPSAAETFARQSLDAFSRSGKLGQRARAQLTLAEILSRDRLTDEGERLFQEGIDTAAGSSDWALASTGWLHYGRFLIEAGHLKAADHAFANSYSLLRQSGIMTGEAAVLYSLSRLRLEQQDFKQALGLIDAAIRISPPYGGRISARRLHQTRAKIQLGLGHPLEALADARIALQSARALRANVVSDTDTRIGMDGLLDETFSVLIEAGNLVYLKTRDPNLLRETFEAAEENRAETLALLPSSSNWRVKLATPEYRYQLSQVLSAQRLSLRLDSSESRRRLAECQDHLSRMEADAGASLHPQPGTVLLRVERNLPPGAAFLSFRLGERVSWLWSVDHGNLRLCRLPAKKILMNRMAAFQQAIQDNDHHRVAQLGAQLYRNLFGGPHLSFQQSSQWFVSLDESLYTVPFPALVVEVRQGRPIYLTQLKTLLVVPGAQLLRSRKPAPFNGTRVLLAGDGIYNRADPRYGKSALLRNASWGMARLPGTGAEVRFAADLWHRSSLLTGERLTKVALLHEIDRGPDVIHIASHVIEGGDRWRAGILALGLDPDGEPDLLTPREIQLHPIPSRLVVMTGCSSGSGDSLPAAGLMGLTRAWLAAGAGAVLATRWPTTDESANGLIGSFYQHLQSSSDGNVPEALRAARRDMIARGGWRAEPSYWSSFFLIGVR